MKTLTQKQLQARKDQAVRFTRDALADPDRAQEIEEESLQDYAERRRITLKNPKGVKINFMSTKRELLDEIEELKERNEELEEQLDQIAGIVAPEEEEDEQAEE